MKQELDLNGMIEVVKPYFSLIRTVQEKSFQGTLQVKDMFIESGLPIVMKPRAKGSIMSDCIKSYLELELANDNNAKVIELNDIPALLIAGKVLVRFNKMDEKFQTSIQKRKGYWKFVNQGEQLDGLPQEVIRIWAAHIPIDKQWSDIARYCLVCFDAGRVIWFNNLTNDYSVTQLSIPLNPNTEKRRTTPKKKKGGDDQSKTGTEQ